MNEKILFVDDEENVLLSYKRNLRREYNIKTALSGQEALEIVKSEGPFAVVISDMRMPEMNGAELLAKISKIANDTARIILTGQADFNTAVEAVNQGSIFRFLTKPCQPDYLRKVIDDGIKHNKLLKAEQELLNKTLKGAIRVLVEMLSIHDQKSFIHVLNLRNLIRTLGEANILSSSWEIEIAALLTRIGLMTIPASVKEKMKNNQKLTDVEEKMVNRFPKLGHDLLANIPRLDDVVRIVLYQNKNFDGTGYPKDNVKGLDIPLGSRIIKILNDLIEVENSGKSRVESGVVLKNSIGLYDPKLLDNILKKICSQQNEILKPTHKQIEISVNEMKVGQMLVKNVESESGQLLVMAGQEITEQVLMRINNWSRLYKIKEPIYVAIEKEDEEENKSDEQPKKKKIFSGDLQELSVIDLVQMLNLNKKSGILKIHGKNKGNIFIKNGQLYGAKTENKSGEEAIYEMVTYENGNFDFERDDNEMEKNISNSTMNVLMEACQVMDESRHFKN